MLLLRRGGAQYMTLVQIEHEIPKLRAHQLLRLAENCKDVPLTFNEVCHAACDVVASILRVRQLACLLS